MKTISANLILPTSSITWLRLCTHVMFRREINLEESVTVRAENSRRRRPCAFGIQIFPAQLSIAITGPEESPEQIYLPQRVSPSREETKLAKFNPIYDRAEVERTAFKKQKKS